MIDLGLSKLLLIGLVALVVIGPEKLPRVARMVGNLLGRAQRYVADVKSEVNRQIELEELKKMKDTVESAARDLEKTVSDSAREVQQNFDETWKSASAGLDDGTAGARATEAVYHASEFRPKKASFRLKQGAMPQWYKRRAGIRTRTLSGAARVAKYRPKLKSQA
ncbi:MAG: Sec-independent protein translocase subunit TatB [Betaproteobacteria bacterium]|nr:Sec-independent protein translocase subunit TatB [Betaproteobacteria bacterium]